MTQSQKTKVEHLLLTTKLHCVSSLAKMITTFKGANGKSGNFAIIRKSTGWVFSADLVSDMLTAFKVFLNKTLLCVET